MYLVLGPLCRDDAFILGVGLHQAAVRRTTNLLNMENISQSVLRIHMFLDLLDPDPDPLVIGMDPDPDPSIVKQK
jgi:hypothetical protein